jgi:dienelactone hydrolase
LPGTHRERLLTLVTRALSLILLLLAADVAAAPVRDLANGATGRIEFFSTTPNGPTPLMAREGPQTPIVGTLRLPKSAAGKVPAMVISHGSGGIQEGREVAWATRLEAQGVATFVVDSFTPRGISSTASDQSQLPTAASVADAFAALKLLATHPAIDPPRIGVMGFSKGGQVALYTALEPFRRGAVDGDLRFAVHIALYASCSIPYHSRAVTRAPIVLLLGGADDYTPASHCRRYADWFREKGADVRMVVYDGAHHGFDSQARQQWLANAQTARGCGLDVDLEPVAGKRWDNGASIPAAEIGQYLRACMKRGATFGGNGSALNGAIEEVKRAVATYLRSGG